MTALTPQPEMNSEEVLALSARLEEMPLEELLRWCWRHFGARAAIGTSFPGSRVDYPAPRVPFGAAVSRVHARHGPAVPGNVAAEGADRDAPRRRHREPAPGTHRRAAGRRDGHQPLGTSPGHLLHAAQGHPVAKEAGAARRVDHRPAPPALGSPRDHPGARTLPFDALRDGYIYKLNPLATWTRDRVRAYLAEHQLPYNPLKDRGYRSIGCVPCTRPVGETEDDRAGRWTGFDKNECGIHTFLGDNI